MPQLNVCTNPRLIGYARVSTAGQDLAYQLERLRAAGCRTIYHEKRSGRDTQGCTELRRLLRSLRSGNILLATASDRIARDPVDLVNILNAVKQAGAGPRLLDEPFIDTSSELADLVTFLVGWAARWHRRRILENTAQRREQARQREVKFGRKPKLNARQQGEIRRRRSAGDAIGELAKV